MAAGELRARQHNHPLPNLPPHGGHLKPGRGSKVAGAAKKKPRTGRSPFSPPEPPKKKGDKKDHDKKDKKEKRKKEKGKREKKTPSEASQAPRRRRRRRRRRWGRQPSQLCRAEEARLQADRSAHLNSRRDRGSARLRYVHPRVTGLRTPLFLRGSLDRGALDAVAALLEGPWITTYSFVTEV